MGSTHVAPDRQVAESARPRLSGARAAARMVSGTVCICQHPVRADGFTHMAFAHGHPGRCRPPAWASSSDGSRSIRRNAAAVLRSYSDPVVHPGDARRRPGGALRLLTLGPGAHRALEDDRAALRLDRDAVGVDLRAAPERLLDLALDLGGGRRRSLHLNQVGHPLDPDQPAYRTLCSLTLVIPLDLAFERDPAIPDDPLDLLVGDRQLALNRRARCPDPAARRCRAGAPRGR